MSMIQHKRRTTLTLGGIAQVLTALNELNLHSMRHRDSSLPRVSSGGYKAISHPTAKAKHAHKVRQR